MNKEIAVVSSYSTDRLIDGKSSKITKEQKGGPALFISSALNKMGLQPKVYHGEEFLVEIAVYDNDEFGRIPTIPQKQIFPLPPTDFAIVSTILDEWDLRNAPEYPGKLFVDVQGYVRDGAKFGEKKVWEDISQYGDSLFCLKGNDREMEYIQEHILEDQRSNRMLITTRGRDGVTIDYQGSQAHITPSEIVTAPHTIGAGDTFFANFVGKFIENDDPEASATFAMQQTGTFLKSLSS